MYRVSVKAMYKMITVSKCDMIKCHDNKVKTLTMLIRVGGNTNSVKETTSTVTMEIVYKRSTVLK